MRSINLRAAKDYPVVSGTLHPGQLAGLNFFQDFLENDKPYAVLAGYAGTGKTHLVGALVRLLQQVCWGPIGVTSPTHQAKIVLQGRLALNGVRMNSEMLTVSTIHSWLELKEEIDDNGSIKFVPQPTRVPRYAKEGCDVLFIDESSMIDTEIGRYIDEAWPHFRGKVLFVGDPCQIPPVGEDDSDPFLRVMADDPKFYGVHFLRDVVRQEQGNPIIQLAMTMRDHIESGDKLYKFPNLMDFVDGNRIRVMHGISLPECQALYTSQESIDNPKYLKALAYRNATVDSLNFIVKMYRKGERRREMVLRYDVGDSYILTEPMLDETQSRIIIPNNAEIIVEGVTEGIEGEGEYQYKVYSLIVSSDVLEKGSTVLLKARPRDPKYQELATLLLNYAKMQRSGSVQRAQAWREYYEFIRQYVPLKMSFALTAHRSQGSTYTYTIIDEVDVFSNRNRYEGNRVAYTALTRASEGVIILR